LRRLRS